MTIRKLFFFLSGLLLCAIGCGDEGDPVLPADILPILQPDAEMDEAAPPPVVAEDAPPTVATDAEASFEQHLMPILAARCAYAGCHVAGGPNGIDLSSYEAFIAGGREGPIFYPGNAQSSDIVEEIVSGRMPPGGPRLSDADIQLFVDWINQQPAAGVNPQPGADDDWDDHDDDHDDHDHDDDHDDDDDHDEDDDDDDDDEDDDWDDDDNDDDDDAD